MRAGLVFLVFAFIQTQFYRAFLAVLAPSLIVDLGITQQVLARASDLWFAGYALMLIPVGWALDHIGPRKTVVALILVEAAGAAIFAAAIGPFGIQVGMALNGMGGAPALMAAYFIYARSYPPSGFGFFAGLVVALGAIGNVSSAFPFAWIVDAVGWRTAVSIAAGISLATALCCALFVRDPPAVPPEKGQSFMALLRIKALWPIYVMVAVASYPANGLRDLWIGPYAHEILGFGINQIGMITLVMGLSMGAGRLLFGTLDRYPAHRKAFITAGNLLCAACFLGLALVPAPGVVLVFLLTCGVGFFGATYPMVLASGKELLPNSALGRGVTLINFFSAAATAGAQFLTIRVSNAFTDDPSGERFRAIFLFFAISLLAGLSVYAFSRNRPD